MRGRHRSPAANGYNRFGPEASGRTRGFYGPGNRFGGRGLVRGRGQGQFRPFRSAPQRKEADIFVEAGRLAAEHLVSKGVLPPDVLSDGRPNGSLTKQGQDFREFRGDGEIQLDGRVSVHSRLGNAGFDLGSGKRRYSEDYSPRGTRNHWKGSKRGATFQGNGSDWGREYGRNNSMPSERFKGSPDNEGWDGVASGHNKDMQVERDIEDVTRKSVENDLVLKTDGSESKRENDALTDKMVLKEADGPESKEDKDVLTDEMALKEADDPEPKIENDALADEMALKESFSGVEKDGQSEADVGLGKDSTSLNQNIEELRDNTASEEIKEKTEGDVSVDFSASEVSNSANNCANLLEFCNTVKVPTRIRSSLASRISKFATVSSSEDELKSNIGSKEYGSAQRSFGGSPSHTNHSTKRFESEAKKVISVDSPDEKETSAAHCVDQNQCMDSQPSLDTEVFSEQSVQDAGNTDPSSGLEQDKCTRLNSSPLDKISHGQPAVCVEELSSAFVPEQNTCFTSNSFPEKYSFHPVDQELGHNSHSCAIVQERGEQRALGDSDPNGGSKKVREWLPPATVRTDFHFDLIEKIGISKEQVNYSQNKPPVDVTKEALPNISQFPKLGRESCIEHAQEKQFFPDSLNYDADITDKSDRSRSHPNDPGQLYPSISGTKKEMPIDIDLSMSSNIPGQYSSRLTNVKEIEVIDLEDDPAPEENANNNAERMGEAVFTGLGAYSNQPQSSGVITDVQDNYDGLMISDYFNSFQNCAPPPADINPLPNVMGIPNGEGTLGDDDSIYMSLDEIPLGFLRTWEQPPSASGEYDKNF